MTKKTFFKTFLISSFLFFISLFTSCKVEWFGGLEDDLDEKLMTFVRFSAADPTGNNPTPKYIDLFYLTGTELTKDDFPKTGSKELYELYPGYKIIGEWKNNQLVPNFVTSDSVTGVVEKCIVPPKTSGYIELYLESTDLEARDDTQYTIHYILQNVYDNNTTDNILPLEGVTDQQWIVNQIDDYRNKVGTIISGDSTTGVYKQSVNHNDNFTIAGDGSTEVYVHLDLNVRSLTFNLDSTPIYGGESWTDSVTDPPVDPQGIITKTKESNKYTIECRHGYDYKRLKEDIQQLRPAKNNYSFYGWTNEGSSSRECGPLENPYDFILSFDDGASNQFPNSVEGDKDFYPVWGPEFYKIYIKMPQMKDNEFIGTIDGIDILSDSNGKYINMSVATSLPPPQLPDSYKAEDFEFAGYKYTNLLALNDGILLSYNSTENTWNALILTGRIANSGVITATWTYKNIYLDPVNGNDNNDGLSAGTAVQSVSKAKELAKDAMTNTSGNSIYLMNKITQTTDLGNLDGITTTTYNNVCIKRAPDVKGTLIEIPSDYMNTGGTETIPGSDGWSDITFDGNSGVVTANSPFIVNNGIVRFKENIIFKNISSDGSVEKGSVVKNNRKLFIGKNLNAGTRYNNFNNISSTKGGLFYNDSSNAELFIDVNNNFNSCYYDPSATALDQRANIAYIRRGKLILRSKAYTDSAIIAVNKDAKIQHNSAVDGAGTIATLVLGDENATGTLNDFTSGYELLINATYTDILSDIAPRYVLAGSTYNASTSTAGWKIDENGKLVYATFGGGSIIIPTEYSAIFALTFNYGSHVYGTGDHSVSPSTSVETVTELPCDIGIILDLQYQGTRKFKVSGGNIQKLSDPSSTSYDPDFTGLEVKILYNGVNTGATYNTSTGKISTGSDWPTGEYVVYISFSYCGIPHSINMPFIIQY